MFKMKMIMSLALVCSMVFSMNAVVFAEEQTSLNQEMITDEFSGQSMYEITDEFVVIDYISYPINNNCIVYEGVTYEVEGFNLVSHGEGDAITVLLLPVEETRITDENLIKLLNEELLRNSLLRSNVTLPYSANVSSGQWYTETPVFNMITDQYYRYTNLTLTNFSAFANKEFSIGFVYGDSYGNWYTHSTNTYYNFGQDSSIKYLNFSSMRYGKFYIASLYGDPSPSYTYTISFSQL